jgi:hypothetical protein
MATEFIRHGRRDHGEELSTVAATEATHQHAAA